MLTTGVEIGRQVRKLTTIQVTYDSVSGQGTVGRGN